jgi:hypothetical protein
MKLLILMLVLVVGFALPARNTCYKTIFFSIVDVTKYPEAGASSHQFHLYGEAGVVSHFRMKT